jgi:FkbM family methyltransferase
MNIRIKFIQFLININENIIFYPRLRTFYESRKSDQDNMTIIFDVGANKGQSIDFFSKIYENVQIYAFEPNPNLFLYLKTKYKNKNNIMIYNLGVSNISGQLELNETITDETSTFEELNYESKYLQKKANILGVSKENIICEKYFVDVIRLNDFIEREKITKIDILKIDTEGHELKCLQGLFINNTIPIDYIQLESHNDDMYLMDETKGQIPFLLKSNGFKKSTVIKHGFGDFNECIYEK